MSHRVFTKGETKNVWGKSPEILNTTLELEQVVEKWREELRSAKPAPDVRLSDDVENFLCGFMYYASLVEMAKKGDGKRNVVFFHVPLFETEKDIRRGTEVTIALIKGLAETSAG